MQLASSQNTPALDTIELSFLLFLQRQGLPGQSLTHGLAEQIAADLLRIADFAASIPLRAGFRLIVRAIASTPESFLICARHNPFIALFFGPASNTIAHFLLF